MSGMAFLAIGLYLGGMYQNKLAFDLSDMLDSSHSPASTNAVVVSCVLWPVLTVFCLLVDLWYWVRR